MAATVSFDPVVKVLSRKPTSGQSQALSFEDTWFTPYEFSQMRQREKNLAQSLYKAARDGRLSSGVNFHGVETLAEKTRRRKRIHNATLCVLQEQELIWNEEEEERVSSAPVRSCDPSACMRIRMAYSRLSGEASSDAVKRALKNAGDVLGVYCEDIDTRITLQRRGSSSSSDSTTSSPTRRPSSQARQLSSRSAKRLFLRGGHRS